MGFPGNRAGGPTACSICVASRIHLIFFDKPLRRYAKRFNASAIRSLIGFAIELPMAIVRLAGSYAAHNRDFAETLAKRVDLRGGHGFGFHG